MPTHGSDGSGVSNYIESGPFFDGRMEKAIKDAADGIEREVALSGATVVRSELNTVLRVQTPAYRLRVTAQPNRPGWKVWDQGSVYGPWLEGTGSRNKTTRFKGYATFRRMTQKIQARAVAIGNTVMVRYMGRMN